MSIDFKCLVWKRVWKISFFGLKQGQDLENRAVHPIKNSQEYPPPPGLHVSDSFHLSTLSYFIKNIDSPL